MPKKRIRTVKPNKPTTDRRCYYCRKKAKIFVGGHPSCGNDHGAARRVQPVVRPMLRSGRAAFLRALRGKIARVPDERPGNIVKAAVLEIVDAKIGKYKGE